MRTDSILSLIGNTPLFELPGEHIVAKAEFLNPGGSIKESIAGAVEAVQQVQREDPRIVVPQQFENPDNPRVHYEETARELWRQTGDQIDCFVAGVGSGGTLQGVGSFLKEHRPGVRIVAERYFSTSLL